jgi:2-oxoglutarate ferredoxin oxidoreductase subunit alpha
MAFDLSQDYHIPVFILTDKYLNENQWCVEKKVFENPPVPHEGKRAGKDSMSSDFKRYDLTAPDGVSPRSVPGLEGGMYIANSYEHDEKGFTTEDAAMRTAMVNKRAKKLNAIIAKSPTPSVYGEKDSQITFVSWGSTKGPILEAMELLKAKKISTKLIHFSWVYPLDKEKVKAVLQNEKRLIDVEGNGTGQLAKLLAMETGIDIKERLLKYDGRQWYPEEIVENIKI